MDIVLSGDMDGIAAAQLLQTLGVPVVYLTAYSDRHLLDPAQHIEPLAYVIKPASFKREQEQERDRAGQKRVAANCEADEQFRLMVTGVTDIAIFTLDPAGNVNSWNRGAEKITGYSAGSVLGHSFFILFTAEDRRRGVPQSELDTAARDGSADNTRWLVRKNGERYWAEGLLSAIRDDDGTLTGFPKITRDATRHKRTQEALEDLEGVHLDTELRVNRADGAQRWSSIKGRCCSMRRDTRSV